MKLYLSSYQLGNETDKLKKMMPSKKIGYIPNARDFTTADPERKKQRTQRNINSLRELELEPELLDLQDYFGKKEEMEKKLHELKAIFVSGGNTFVLRQAMKLSGLDELLKQIRHHGTNFLYAGYSAAGCVLSPSLKTYAIVDDPHNFPYPEIKETIWDGLGFIDFAFMPHWNSDHPESADVDKEIAECKKNNIPYRAIRDGEVIIVE